MDTPTRIPVHNLSSHDKTALETALTNLDPQAGASQPVAVNRPQLPQRVVGRPAAQAFDLIRQPARPQRLAPLLKPTAAPSPQITPSAPSKVRPMVQAADTPAPIEIARSVSVPAAPALTQTMVSHRPVPRYQPHPDQQLPALFDTNHYHQALLPAHASRSHQSRWLLAVIGLTLVLATYLIYQLV